MGAMKKLFAFLLAVGCLFSAQAATSPQIKITIVDMATGAPIKGARADYYVEVSDGGRKRGDLFRVRGESNDRGEVVFAAKEFADVSYGLFGMSTNYGGPTLAVFAGGYEPFSYSPRLMSKNLREASQWEFVNPMQIKLRPILAPLPKR
jgi:hypothetical protein